MSTDQLRGDLADAAGPAVDSITEQEAGRLEVTLGGPDDLDRVVGVLADLGVTHLITISGVDAGDSVDVLYQFLAYGEYADEDLGRGTELTLRIALPAENPTVGTITDQIAGATLYERELMDMLGVEVTGHPNPEPLLLPDDYEGDPPLRASQEEVD